jgi:excisionase family DNA binding protein
MPEVLTAQQAAEFLQTSRDTVIRKARAGEIPAAKLGREWRFRKADLDAWRAAGGRMMVRETIIVEGEPFVATIRRTPQGWHGEVEDLPGCEARGRTLEELRRNLGAVIYDCQFAPEPELDAALTEELKRRMADPANQGGVPLADFLRERGL